MSVSFETTTAEYSGASTITFYYYDPVTGSQIIGIENFISITTTNADMTLSFASTSDVVGENVTYTLDYTPSVTISANSVVQI